MRYRTKRDLAHDLRLRPLLHEMDINLAAQPIKPVPPAMNGAQNSWVEMLIRPRRKGEAVPADQFIQRVSVLGVAREFDLWVLRRALRWLKTQPAVQLCSVNLSGQSLSQRTFLREVLAEVENSGVDPSRICFEVTETDPVTDFVAARTFSKVLRGMGARMALDDFGGGVSNILLLIHKEMDYLKIDGRFIRRMRKGNHSYQIVRGLVAMAGIIGLDVIAECVETEAQCKRVRDVGIQYLQGYLFGEPRVVQSLNITDEDDDSNESASRK